ncbi:TonB-dependent receptor [Lacinutrix sp. Hel_I_90]|uniref:SusC/RagA family TonB-linked outer membrane protein n=1 Tax=Lacinutrix sp. Hel_I_90 TaxID=1249999 RepID=UPI0005C80763|nr:TonB-dependent receptor [Lacinutrix sp. Hel_I_90]
MKIKFTALLIFAFCISTYAQNVNVTGTVISKMDNMPIVGVNVLVKDSNKGDVTDFDGNFSINDVPVGATLQISYIGYASQEIVITNDDSLRVLLSEDAAALDEVVLVGYGTQKKKEITGAVSVVNSETIENLKPTRIEQALQGQVAGVNITSQSGSPGSASNIRIRGISTNGDNRPLILVDGNVIEDLSVVNPGDIANITVLKDATAGIYGVRAANGVILITTKTGRKSMPMQFDYDAYVGFQQTTREIPLLNATEYVLLRNEAAAANGQTLPFPNVSRLGRGTDWQGEVFETAPIFNNNINVRGGTEKSTYSFGSSLLTQDGIVGGSKANFTRYTTRINFGTELMKNLNIKANLLYTGTIKKSLPENGLGSALFNALNIDPTLTVRQEDGSFTRAENYPIEVINPLAQIESINNLAKVDKLSGVFGVNYKFLDDFSAEVNYQWNYSEVRDRAFFPEADFGNIGSNTVFDREINQLDENENFFRDYTFDALINYEKSFNDIHNLKVTLGNSIFKTTGDGYSFTGRDLGEVTFTTANLNDAAEFIDNFETPVKRSHRLFDSRLLSYFGRVQYNYKSKYLFSAVVRRDGSTSFGPENKFGIFPSASLGWVASDESFLENSNTINFLKLRTSYGILGNDRIPGFAFVSLLDGEGTYVLNDELASGVAIGRISNPEIQWEEQKTFDFGVETRLFNNKINITADYFDRTTENLLLVVESSRILGSSAPGAANPVANAGTVQNSGVEFQIGYNDRITEDLKFNVSYNFTTLDNEVLEVNNGIGYEVGGVFGIGQANPPSRMEVGQPIGVFYGLQTNGIFQSQAEVDAHPSQLALGANAEPGDLRFVDINGDGVLDEDDRTYIGSPIPEVTMGLNLSLDYKDFDFQTYFFASIGNDIVRNYDRNDPVTNKTIYALNRWTGPGTSNTNPRVTTGATSNGVFSDYYVEDGSFIRAQNMQLGYTFNKDKLSNIGLRGIRLYMSVSNVFTLTKYRGFDPTASNGAPIGGGIDPGFYPNPRTFLLGTNVKF